MSTKTYSKSLVLPIDKRRTTRKIQIRSKSSARTKKLLFLRALAICIWIMAVLLSILFYFALRKDLVGIEWLAGLLLGMVILGWIVIAYYYRAADKPFQMTMREIDMANKPDDSQKKRSH
jgi:hypothetical protein